MENNQFNFTNQEWETCLKVLTTLKDNPFHNPENEKFAGLITKIAKNARKESRKESYSEKKTNDFSTIKSSSLAEKAINGETKYADYEKEKTTFTPLEIPKNCYCCNESYQLAHSFYVRLCPKCAEENYTKRFENIDLTNRNVILTGGRVKVGYATGLKILRSGANLILTTRFPALALEQYQNEKDYEVWKNRIWIYGLDLRNLNAIQDFISYLKINFDNIDILINNAAQTIKYTDEYYLPIIEKESQKLIEYGNFNNLIANKTEISKNIKQLEYAFNEKTNIELSRFGQPVDYREKTSWNSTLEEISTFELIEVNLINQIAPYLLIKELKPLMKNSNFKERFIINVTSSEGIFSYNNKTIFHPHTNMTKAALNMMTLTSSKEFAEEQIYMCAVDVGWISTGAKESLRKKQFEVGYIPPLDSVDAAARIFHPIIEGLKGNYLIGVLLKNYKVNNW